jgi:hypothetical protein
MRRSLASIAQFEFIALLQDTKNAVDSLRLQRESVKQAIERVQEANGHADRLPDDMVIQVIGLMDQLRRLNAALERLVGEVEGIQAIQSSPTPEPFLILTIPLAPVSSEDQPLVGAEAV